VHVSERHIIVSSLVRKRFSNSKVQTFRSKHLLNCEHHINTPASKAQHIVAT